MVDKQIIPKDLTILCYICFDTLSAKLFKHIPKITFPKEFELISCPLFVTWTIGNEDNLRGCIGTFQESLLKSNIPKYSLISSLQDSRFDPISKDEFEKLSVAVSLLVNFENGNNVYDWEIGKHGIEIFYKNYSGTFLPEVAAEQGWDKKTTLEYLLRKSGCKTSLDKIEKDIKLVRYQSYKTKINWSDYNEYINKKI